MSLKTDFKTPFWQPFRQEINQQDDGGAQSPPASAVDDDQPQNLVVTIRVRVGDFVQLRLDWNTPVNGNPNDYRIRFIGGSLTALTVNGDRTTTSPSAFIGLTTTALQMRARYDDGNSEWLVVPREDWVDGT